MTTRCMAGVELWAIMELETSHELPWCHCKTVHVALCKKQQLSVVGTCCRCVFNYWCHVLYGRFIPIKVQTRMATDLENTAQGQKMNKLCLLGPKERSPSEARKWASTGSRGCAVFGIPWRKAIPFVGSCWCNVAQVLINANNNDIKHSCWYWTTVLVRAIPPWCKSTGTAWTSCHSQMSESTLILFQFLTLVEVKWKARVSRLFLPASHPVKTHIPR